MPLKLFTLAAEKAAAIETSQASFQFFRQPLSATINLAISTSITFAVASWFTSDGGVAAAFPIGQKANYLTINGVLVQPGLYTVQANKVTLGGSTAITLRKSSPITLQTYNTRAFITKTDTFVVP